MRLKWNNMWTHSEIHPKINETSLKNQWTPFKNPSKPQSQVLQTYIKDLYTRRIKFYDKTIEFIQKSNKNQKIIKSLQSSGQIYLGT